MAQLRQIAWGIGLTGLFGLTVAGCGTSGRAIATPSYSNTGHASTPRSIRTSRPSSSPSTPTSIPTSAYNPSVTRALAWVHPRTGIPVGAPTWLPSMPSSVGQYLAATATADASHWAVELSGTSQPYEINNPAIRRAASTRPWINFAGQTLTAAQLSTSTMGLLEAYSQLGPSHPPLQSGPPQQISLGHGLTGSVYTNGTVLWHEGDWTLVVQGTSRSHDVTEAKPLVAYLHTAYLPPHTGLVDVYQNSASIDWIQGHQLYAIQGGPLSARDVLHLAVAWRPLSSPT